MHVPHALRSAAGALLVVAAAACDDAERISEPMPLPSSASSNENGSAAFRWPVLQNHHAVTQE